MKNALQETRFPLSIGCQHRLLSIIKSFHDGMLSTVQDDGETSFEVKSGVKQGCVLAPTLFGIFFAMLFRHAFKGATEGVYLHSRSDGKLFNISRLKAKSKTRTVLIRDMFFADDAALAAHSEGQLQSLTNRYKACDILSLTISLKKNQGMCQGTAIAHEINLKDHQLEIVNQFTYLCSTTTNNLSVMVPPNNERRVFPPRVFLFKITSP